MTTVEEVIQKYLGKTSEPVIHHVERGAISRYCDAIGDSNPLYINDEYARQAKYGSVISPPCFFGLPAIAGWGLPKFVFEVPEAFREAGLPNGLDGGIDYDFFFPVRAGDILVAWSRVADISLRESKEGAKRIFIVVETTYTNQNGACVAKSRHTLIVLPGD